MAPQFSAILLLFKAHLNPSLHYCLHTWMTLFLPSVVVSSRTFAVHCGKQYSSINFPKKPCAHSSCSDGFDGVRRICRIQRLCRIVVELSAKVSHRRCRYPSHSISAAHTIHHINKPQGSLSYQLHSMWNLAVPPHELDPPEGRRKGRGENKLSLR